MEISLVIHLQITCFLIQNAKPQYYQQYYQQPSQQQAFYQPQPYNFNGYENRHKHKRNKHNRQKQRHQFYKRAASSSSDSESSETSSENNSNECNQCSCDNCENPIPCCKATCDSCSNSGQGLLIVPYPYPILLLSATTETITMDDTTISETTTTPTSVTTITQPVTTTTRPVTTTTRPVITTTIKPKTTTEFKLFLRKRVSKKVASVTKGTTKIPKPKTVNLINKTVTDKPKIIKQTETSTDIDTDTDYISYKDLVSLRTGRKKHHKYIMTSMKQMKNLGPKYGIVPIPDEVADKLMKQLRNIKKHNNFRALKPIRRHF